MKCVLGCVLIFHINLKSRLNRDMEEKGIVAVCRLPELLPDSGAGVRQELRSGGRWVSVSVSLHQQQSFSPLFIFLHIGSANRARAV